MMKIKFLLFLLCIGFLSCSKLDKNKIIKYQITDQFFNIQFDILEHQIRVEDQLSFRAEKPTDSIHLLLNKQAKIVCISLDEAVLDYHFQNISKMDNYFQPTDSVKGEEYGNAAELTVYFGKKLDKGDIKITYHLTATDSVEKSAFSREYIAYQVKGYIGHKGVFLSPDYFWYPTLPSGFSNYRIEVSCPDSLHIITQGELTKNLIKNNKRYLEWQIRYPAEGLHLVGAKYDVQTSKYNEIDIYTFFFPETQELASSYLSACQRYLAMYEERIGPYPFKKFAVVENFFPTGYGMPSYTLLGSQVLRLPFIIYTSLGHEIAHNWWGNSVYVDYKSGNWCEGLTTYFADYLYKELSNPQEAATYRRDLARDFTVYVKATRDYPLYDFKERTESASRAIGYGKSAMVFHQLRKFIGDSLFGESFKDFYNNNKFQKASWSDIQHSVEKISQQNLDWFFEQWIQRAGAPTIRLLNKSFDQNILNIELAQDEPIYRLIIPIKILTSNGELSRTVELTQKRQSYVFPLEWTPHSIVVDPEFDLLRKLDRNEISPTLSELFAQDSVVVVLPDQCEKNKFEIYKNFLNMFIEGEDKFTVRSADKVDLNKSENLILLGTPAENSLFQKIKFLEQAEVKVDKTQIILNSEIKPKEQELVVLSLHDKNNENRNYAVILIGNKGKIGRVGYLLKHYGKYSFLVFTDGINTVKGVYEVKNSPLSVNF
jgi:aminopeptidase N